MGEATRQHSTRPLASDRTDVTHPRITSEQ
jgi:hypothetical protein